MVETEAKQDKKVNQGRNLRTARQARGMSQEELAFKVNLSQTEISRMERSVTIDEAKIQELAKALDCSPDYIRDFEQEEAMKMFNNNNTGNDTSSNTYQQGDGDQTINQTFYPLDTVKELFEKMLLMKDDEIARLTKQVEKLTEENKQLKKGNK